MDKVNALTQEMEIRIKEADSKKKFDPSTLKVGVDLGTSNIVITVLDSDNRPIAGALKSASVVKDGIVVDYIRAIKILKNLKEEVEKKLDVTLTEAATAIPPGIMEGNIKVIVNVVEAAGFNVIKVVDEPEAAAKVLQIQNGAVVDIGGGTTGISILREGIVVHSMDEASGGTHITLVLAGSLDLSLDAAEQFKQEQANESQTLAIVRPVIEKIAHIIGDYIPKDIAEIFLVGGTSCLKGVEQVIEAFTSIRTIKPENPLLVTPIGIAMFARP